MFSIFFPNFLSKNIPDIHSDIQFTGIVAPSVDIMSTLLFLLNKTAVHRVLIFFSEKLEKLVYLK
jgi:hypothetical protein